jgi:hypothetical protein
MTMSTTNNKPSTHERIIAALAALQWMASSLHDGHRDYIGLVRHLEEVGGHKDEKMVEILRGALKQTEEQSATLLSNLAKALEQMADWTNARDAISDWDEAINPAVELALNLGEFADPELAKPAATGVQP